MGTSLHSRFMVGVLCGAVASALTSIAFYTLKTPEGGSESTATQISENVVCESNNTEIEQQGITSSQTLGKALQSSKPTNARDTEQKNADPAPDNSRDCDEKCVRGLVSKMLDGSSFSSADWDNIRDKSHVLAAAISKDPKALGALNEIILYALEEHEISGLMTIASMLEGDQAIDVIMNAASYSSSHKAVALQALAQMSISSESATREIENLIVNEQDPKVIAAALNALETTDNHAFSSQTWQSLASQLSYIEDEQIKGAILQSLAKHNKGDRQILRDRIDEGLSSQSGDFQRSSIEALRYFIAAQEENEEFSQNENFSDLKSRLNAIAANPNADTSIRIDALTLLDEAF